MVLFWIESLMHFQDVMKQLDSVASYRPQSSWTSAKNTRARLTRRSTPVVVTRSYQHRPLTLHWLKDSV